ncbi:MAG: hypothetical protein IT161_09670 [Bryobacterales bacterium]|nr:hypothetical protein [Bryobacterales bacterium]
MRTLLMVAVLIMGLLWAADTNVSGTWAFDVTTDAGSGSPAFEFKQDGAKLTGKYSGMAGEAPLTGTVQGNKIQWEFKIDMNGESSIVKYQGTIESPTSMKGTADYPGIGQATWTAKKQ